MTHPVQEHIDDLLDLEAFLKGEMNVDEWPEYLQHLIEESHPHITLPSVQRAIVHCIHNGLVHVYPRMAQ